MKVLLLSTRDLVGGAARAAYRLHCGLLKSGVDSRMLVLTKTARNNDTVKALYELKKETLYHKIIRKYRTKKWAKDSLNNFRAIENHEINSEYVHLADVSSDVSILDAIRDYDFDILHIHWVDGFLRLNELNQITKPIVWTMHDCMPFTAVCHYFEQCSGFTDHCVDCPVMPLQTKIVQKRYAEKQCVYSKNRVSYIAPSRWLQKMAQESSLLRDKEVYNIPNLINTEIFHPIDKATAKKALGVRDDEIVLLFGAMNAGSDKRKGFDLLIEALNFLPKNINEKSVRLLVFGAETNDIDYGFPVQFLGTISNDIFLNIIYSAADVFIMPSKYENLSCVILECLSCETPIVALNIGGNGDMILHKENGYLAKAYSAEDLAAGVIWILENNSGNQLGENGRLMIEKQFSQAMVVSQHIEIYNYLLSENII